MNSSPEIKYLVFDIESVPDPRLIGRVRYQGQNLDDETAVRKYQLDILDDTDGSTFFIPVPYQYPVAVCIARIRDDFSLIGLARLDEPEYRTREIVKLFWETVEEKHPEASIVSFNGRGFDMPLMELMAYRYGFSAKRHFRDKWGSRYRFGTRHIDLQDWLTNFGAIRMHGGLNLLAKILGKPGKLAVKGDEVYDLYIKGKIREINDYCLHDVLDTYFVFLRTRVMQGDITVKREQDIIAHAKDYIMKNAESIPALQVYLDNWGDWNPWP